MGQTPSGVWVPPVVWASHQDDALQFNSQTNQWVPLRDQGSGRQVSLPFQVYGTSQPTCYANCDGSTVNPVLNANDFQCFLNRYAAGDPYANCDGSTVPPVLNANDFQCFLNKYAAGCT